MRPIPPRTALALAGLATLAACGGPLLFAELELQSVQVTLPKYTFPGTPPGVPLVKDVAFDLGANVPSINQKGVTFDLRLTSMTLVLDTTGPISSFDGVDRVRISALHPPSTTLPDLVLIDWVNPHTATGVTHVTATSQSDADLKPYLDAGVVTLRAEYTGAGLPTGPWTADVSADFFLRLKLNYGAYL